MNSHDDLQLFLEALETMPDDVFQAKFEGSESKRVHKQKKITHTVFDKTIDLHGLTTREALTVVRTALSNSKGKKHRILVITGKGNHSVNKHSRIKEVITPFLDKAGLLYIREYKSASSENGGDGAIEIFTK